MNEQNLEQELQDKGLNAARVTPERIDAVIESEHYFTAGNGIVGLTDNNGGYPASLDLLTFCVLVLKNGYTVTGQSACASAKNFDFAIGCKIARENAREKIWALEGYLLRERLATQS